VQQVADAGLDDGRLLATGLHARSAVPGMPAGRALVAGVVEAAERVDHHPDLVLRPGHVDVALVSHDVGRLTQRDRRLASLVRTPPPAGASTSTSGCRTTSPTSGSGRTAPASVRGMSEAAGTVVPDVPSPLGWCSPCLAERARTPAAVLVEGTGVCEQHHERLTADRAQQGDQMAAMAAQAQEQLRGLMGGMGGPGAAGGLGDPRRAGF